MYASSGKQDDDLLDIIEDEIRINFLELNTSMPGIITSYDPSSRLATVKPSFKRTRMDGKVVERPELLDVPVIFPYSGTQGITFPLKSGTPCLLIFSQRALDTWRDSREEAVKVNSTRLHDLSDALCLPTFGSNSDTEELKDGFQINFDKIWIGDAQGSPLSATGEKPELLTILSTILELFETPLTSSMGPVNYDPAVITKFQEMRSALEAMQP